MTGGRGEMTDDLRLVSSAALFFFFFFIAFILFFLNFGHEMSDFFAVHIELQELRLLWRWKRNPL